MAAKLSAKRKAAIKDAQYVEDQALHALAVLPGVVAKVKKLREDLEGKETNGDGKAAPEGETQ